MNIHVGADCVGAWSFHLPVADTGEPERQWHRLARAVGSTLERLLDDRLLQVPLSFVLESWEPGQPPRFTRTGTDNRKSVGPAIASLLGGARHLGTLDIRGGSVIASPLGERALEGVLGLTAIASWRFSSVRVDTLSDVWMPYDLQARPHPEVAALNAPRLKAALEAIERMLGVTALSEDTRFAKVDGYELQNYTAFGDVLDLQDMGYDESWIAERWPDPDPAT